MIFLGQRSVKFLMTFFQNAQKIPDFSLPGKISITAISLFLASDVRLKSQSRTNATCQASSTMMPDQKAMDTGNCLCFDHYNFPTLLRCVFCLRIQFHPLEKKARETWETIFSALKKLLTSKASFLLLLLCILLSSIEVHPVSYYCITAPSTFKRQIMLLHRTTALAICKMQTCFNYLTSFSL